MKVFLVATILLLISACSSQQGHVDFYKSFANVNDYPFLEKLPAGEEPKVYGSKDLSADRLKLQSKGYVAIGSSSFNGVIDKSYIAQAKNVGASVVLVSSEYTNTETTTANLFLPSSSTTNSSGQGMVGGSNVIYSGTSTTTTTKVVPYTQNYRRYDQAALYFVKSNQKFRVGVLFQDLTTELRRLLERNTGVYVYNLMENSAAFNSNILIGDVITHLNGMPTLNAKQSTALFAQIPKEAESVVVTVIRNGKVKDVEVKLL